MGTSGNPLSLITAFALHSNPSTLGRDGSLLRHNKEKAMSLGDISSSRSDSGTSIYYLYITAGYQL